MVLPHVDFSNSSRCTMCRSFRGKRCSNTGAPVKEPAQQEQHSQQPQLMHRQAQQFEQPSWQSHTNFTATAECKTQSLDQNQHRFDEEKFPLNLKLRSCPHSEVSYGSSGYNPYKISRLKQINQRHQIYRNGKKNLIHSIPIRFQRFTILCSNIFTAAFLIPILLLFTTHTQPVQAMIYLEDPMGALQYDNLPGPPSRPKGYDASFYYSDELDLVDNGSNSKNEGHDSINFPEGYEPDPMGYPRPPPYLPIPSNTGDVGLEWPPWQTAPHSDHDQNDEGNGGNFDKEDFWGFNSEENYGGSEGIEGIEGSDHEVLYISSHELKQATPDHYLTWPPPLEISSVNNATSFGNSTVDSSEDESSDSSIASDLDSLCDGVSGDCDDTTQVSNATFYSNMNSTVEATDVPPNNQTLVDGDLSNMESFNNTADAFSNSTHFVTNSSNSELNSTNDVTVAGVPASNEANATLYDELNEDFNITLSDSTNATIGTNPANATDSANATDATYLFDRRRRDVSEPNISDSAGESMSEASTSSTAAATTFTFNFDLGDDASTSNITVAEQPSTANSKFSSTSSTTTVPNQIQQTTQTAPTPQNFESQNPESSENNRTRMYTSRDLFYFDDLHLLYPNGQSNQQQTNQQQKQQHVYYDSKQARFGQDFGPRGEASFVNVMLPPRFDYSFLMDQKNADIRRGGGSSEFDDSSESKGPKEGVRRKKLWGYRGLRGLQGPPVEEEGANNNATEILEVDATNVALNGTNTTSTQSTPSAPYTHVEKPHEEYSEYSEYDQHDEENQTEEQKEPSQPTQSSGPSEDAQQSEYSDYYEYQQMELDPIHIFDYFCLEDFIEWRKMHKICEEMYSDDVYANDDGGFSNVDGDTDVEDGRGEANGNAESDESVDGSYKHVTFGSPKYDACMSWEGFLPPSFTSTETSNSEMESSKLIEGTVDFVGNSQANEESVEHVDNLDSGGSSESDTNNNIIDSTRPITILVRRGRCSFSSKAELATVFNQMFALSRKSNRIHSLIVYNNGTITNQGGHGVAEDQSEENEKLIEMSSLKQVEKNQENAEGIAGGESNAASSKDSSEGNKESEEKDEKEGETDVGLLYITTSSGRDVLQRMKQREIVTGMNPHLDVSLLLSRKTLFSHREKRQLRNEVQAEEMRNVQDTHESTKQDGNYEGTITNPHDEIETHDVGLAHGWFFPATLSKFCLSCGPSNAYGFATTNVGVGSGTHNNDGNGNGNGVGNGSGDNSHPTVPDHPSPWPYEPGSTYPFYPHPNGRTPYEPRPWVEAIRKLMIAILVILLAGPVLLALQRWHSVGGTIRIARDENGARRLRVIAPNLEVFVNGVPGGVEVNGTKLDRRQVFELPEVEFEEGWVEEDEINLMEEGELVGEVDVGEAVRLGEDGETRESVVEEWQSQEHNDQEVREEDECNQNLSNAEQTTNFKQRLEKQQGQNEGVGESQMQNEEQENLNESSATATTITAAATTAITTTSPRAMGQDDDSMRVFQSDDPQVHNIFGMSSEALPTNENSNSGSQEQDQEKSNQMRQEASHEVSGAAVSHDDLSRRVADGTCDDTVGSTEPSSFSVQSPPLGAPIESNEPDEPTMFNPPTYSDPQARDSTEVPPSTPTAQATPATQSIQPAQQVPSTPTPANIPNILPTQSRESNASNTNRFVSSSVCSICLIEFEPRELVRVLPRCNHFYHTECILPWLTERQGCCPMCKTPVLPEEYQRNRHRALSQRQSPNGRSRSSSHSPRSSSQPSSHSNSPPNNGATVPIVSQRGRRGRAIFPWRRRAMARMSVSGNRDEGDGRVESEHRLQSTSAVNSTALEGVIRSNRAENESTEMHPDISAVSSVRSAMDLERDLEGPPQESHDMQELQGQGMQRPSIESADSQSLLDISSNSLAATIPMPDDSAPDAPARILLPLGTEESDVLNLPDEVETIEGEETNSNALEQGQDCELLDHKNLESKESQ